MRKWIASLSISLLLTANPALAATPDVDKPDPELRQRLEAAIAASSSFRDRFDAEVWLMDMKSRLGKQVKNPTEALRILKTAHQEATRAQLSPELVLAVIDIESRFDRFAISKAGALGLMQVMPFWLKELDRPDDNLFDIDTNLRMGCTILRFYLDKEKGHVGRALARYNGSAGSWRYPNKVLGTYKKRWRND